MQLIKFSEQQLPPKSDKLLCRFFCANNSFTLIALQPVASLVIQHRITEDLHGIPLYLLIIKSPIDSIELKVCRPFKEDMEFISAQKDLIGIAIHHGEMLSTPGYIKAITAQNTTAFAHSGDMKYAATGKVPSGMDDPDPIP